MLQVVAEVQDLWLGSKGFFFGLQKKVERFCLDFLEQFRFHFLDFYRAGALEDLQRFRISIEAGNADFSAKR